MFFLPIQDVIVIIYFMRTITTKFELAKALGVGRPFLDKMMLQPDLLHDRLKSEGIEFAWSKSAKPATAAKTAEVHEWDRYKAERAPRLAEIGKAIVKLTQERDEILRMFAVIDKEFRMDVSCEKPDEDDDADGEDAVNPLGEHLEDVYNSIKNEPDSESSHASGEEADGTEAGEDSDESPPEENEGGYELYPRGKPYDCYGVFDESSKKAFLRIKIGEYWPQYEILPEAHTRNSLRDARQRMIEEFFDLRKFLAKPVGEQARIIFHLSHETQILLKDYLEDNNHFLTGVRENDAAISRFMANFKEWRKICYEYYMRFVVNTATREVNQCTGETVTADEVGVSKEYVEKLEKLRMKWHRHLPKDIQRVKFTDMPEYVLRENPDAWVNPESGKVEIRPPKPKDKPEGKMSFEESVRWMDNDALSAAVEHYGDLVRKEADFGKKDEYRRKGAAARNELRSRKAKYGRQ